MNQTAEAVHHAVARIVHQFHGALLSGLEAHGGAGGDVEMLLIIGDVETLDHGRADGGQAGGEGLHQGAADDGDRSRVGQQLQDVVDQARRAQPRGGQDQVSDELGRDDDGAVAVDARIVEADLVLLGLAGTLMHQVKTSSTEHTPIGLIVALISVGAVALALRLLRSSRGALYLTSLTFGITVFQLAQRQGGGEVLIPANDVGTIWAYGSIILCAIIILFPQIRPAAWRRSASGHR